MKGAVGPRGQTDSRRVGHRRLTAGDKRQPTEQMLELENHPSARVDKKH